MELLHILEFQLLLLAVVLEDLIVLVDLVVDWMLVIPAVLVEDTD
jgi:hypothetical protein